MIDLLAKKAKKLVLVKGNHDTILRPIAGKRMIEISDYFRYRDVLICHGHRIIKGIKGIKTIIIGHEHPAVSLVRDARKETYKCFLTGRYNSKKIIVMPSLSFVSYGTDILRESNLSPYLKGGIVNFRCYVLADRIYDFGTIARMRKRIS